MKKLFVLSLLAILGTSNLSFAQNVPMTQDLPYFACKTGPVKVQGEDLVAKFKFSELQLNALVPAGSADIYEAFMKAEAFVGGSGEVQIEVILGSKKEGATEEVSLKMELLRDVFTGRDLTRFKTDLAKEGVSAETLDRVQIIRGFEFNTYIPFFEALSAKGEVLFRFVQIQSDGVEQIYYSCR